MTCLGTLSNSYSFNSSSSNSLNGLSIIWLLSLKISRTLSISKKLSLAVCAFPSLSTITDFNCPLDFFFALSLLPLLLLLCSRRYLREPSCSVALASSNAFFGYLERIEASTAVVPKIRIRAARVDWHSSQCSRVCCAKLQCGHAGERLLSMRSCM